MITAAGRAPPVLQPVSASFQFYRRASGSLDFPKPFLDKAIGLLDTSNHPDEQVNRRHRHERQYDDYRSAPIH